MEEAGSAECRVEVEDDGGLPGLSFEWLLQGVGPELSDPRAPTVTFTASGNGGGLGWQGEFILVIIVRDAQGLETQGRTQVTITPALSGRHAAIGDRIYRATESGEESVNWP